MTIATKGFSALASRYAVSLMDLAEKAGDAGEVEKNLSDLQFMIKSLEELSTLISSPLISKTYQKKAIVELAIQAKFHELTKNLLGVMAQNGRLNIVQQVITAYMDEAAKRRGEMVVDIKVAQDLTEKQKKDLIRALEKSTGATVKLNAKVDPSILGGMIVTVGSHMIDDSILRKLERLKIQMQKQAAAQQNVA